ncbi:MAG: CBS domain-containing protein [Verrucomicrobia bacterium]|nr:CBS domain-containing protein [Verrucomicrobiota bacterium]
MEIFGTINEILRAKGSQVWTTTPEATVFDAIKLMAEKNVGALLVMEGDRLVGVISERDYTRKVILLGKGSKTTPVRDILTALVVSVTPTHTVEDCMQLMTRHHVRHLPVLEGGKVVGIVSIGDLVNWIINVQRITITQLRNYISGERSA